MKPRPDDQCTCGTERCQRGTFYMSAWWYLCRECNEMWTFNDLGERIRTTWKAINCG